MTDLLPPTWLAEDLPILVAAVELVDYEGTADFRRVAQVAELPEDAPVAPALHLPLPARWIPARSSDDPRSLVTATVPTLTELAATLGAGGIQLRMPDLRVR